MEGTALRAHRLHAVRRRWPDHLWDRDGFSRWRTWGERRYAYFLATAALFAVSYLDINLLSGRDDPFWPSSLLHASRAGRAILALLLACNGLVLAAYLSARGAPPSQAPGRRLARVFLGSLPVFGLVLIPFETRSRGVRGGDAPFAGTAASLLVGRTPRPGSWFRFAVCAASRSLPALIAWLVCLQIVPCLALLSWLGSASRSTAAGLVAVAVSVTLHGLLFVATRRHIATLDRIGAGGWMGLAMRWGPYLLLLPVPAALLGLVSWLPWARENRDERTLSYAGFARRGQGELRWLRQRPARPRPMLRPRRRPPPPAPRPRRPADAAAASPGPSRGSDPGPGPRPSPGQT